MTNKQKRIKCYPLKIECIIKTPKSYIFSGANYPTACNGAQQISHRRLRAVKQAFSIYASQSQQASYIWDQLSDAGEKLTAVIVERDSNGWALVGSAVCVALGKEAVWII